ncbi:MAG: glycosyltransferase, partial [Pseudomonadota bacterium]
GGDLGFDPEFPVRDPQGLHPYVRMKNALQSMQIETADALFSSTRWQASTYPDSVSDRMHVLHEGVDTRRSKPDETAELVLGDGRRLTRSDKVISFVNRNLEPHRGFHVFMRALPTLLTDDPDLHVVIVGGDGVSYGRSPKEGGTWKEVLLNEVSKDLPADWEARVHFTGLLKHDQLTRLFQIARTHVYLTYPFVPSWSLLEAMSCGTPVIANNVAPVEEFVSHGETGFLIDLFDQEALVEAIRHVLSAPEDVAFLGDAARVMIKNHYDLDTVCLPRRIQFVEGLMDQSLSSAIRS